jgi:hypothetical protein
MRYDDQIDGNFEGTGGASRVYRLASGQVWRQVGSADLEIVYMYSPAATVDTSRAPALLHVEGFSKAIPVERVG